MPRRSCAWETTSRDFVSSVTDPYAAPRIVRDAAIALPKGAEAYMVNDWTEEHVNFFRSIEITKHMLFVILSLMVAVAAFNIVSTMVMVVKDKRRDIAILRTFGSSPRSILSVFVVQGSLIGGLGIAGGLIAGVLLAVNLQRLVHGLEGILGFKFLDARVYFMSDLPAYVQLARSRCRSRAWRSCWPASRPSIPPGEPRACCRRNPCETIEGFTHLCRTPP